ncbi:AVN_HP_G0046750.mRNA.1.CDS.1 [Saccharomyces cerevisiae]|nr:ANL_HP_G0193920.mRNA.1.CDS.1 [Saccharomyces cerevisiae]CAI4971021.1 ANL_HP_G0033190.mRNA.1.CDS.1 [Saccharomyces cerevisiae]CAI5004121.1 AVN_HP_G0046750.mRNA.1.CDS.1 [Saccharomyces cerevisiae]CAI5109655.1 ANL_HP_G0108390.mRNA.1.CDS.1 [Saccharomyces cerevisiae]CAI6429577.1 ANL_HP_G0193920.mRNA.1.CDS.1 [Saccharomyces cerevisiae]
MSFFDIEAQSSKGNSQQEPQFSTNQKTKELSNLIETFAEQSRVLEKECTKIGSKRDSKELRYKIETELIPNCTSVRDKIESNILIHQNGKLSADFKNLKTKYQSLQQSYNQRKKIHPRTEAVRQDPESSYISIKVNEQSPLLHNEGQHQLQLQEEQEQQQQGLSQEELDFQTIIHQERSQQIGRIHTAVQEVNAIFHQLGSLVKEQGEQVTTIDENISHLHDNMQNANKQLSRADQHQRDRNKCGKVTLIIIIVVCMVVLLAVLS